MDIYNENFTILLDKKQKKIALSCILVREREEQDNFTLAKYIHEAIIQYNFHIRKLGLHLEEKERTPTVSYTFRLNKKIRKDAEFSIRIRNKVKISLSRFINEAVKYHNAIVRRQTALPKDLRIKIKG